MKKIFLIVILIAFTLFSCRFAPFDDARAPKSYNDWATLFDDYWDKMNRNYVFFSLQESADTWDDVYNKYHSEFAKLTDPIGTNEDETKTALRYYYDIVSEYISDHHYLLTFKNGDKSIQLAPPSIKKYKEDLGRTDDQAFEHFYYNTSEEDWNQTEFNAERQRNILKNTFGIDADTSRGYRQSTKADDFFGAGNYRCYVINNKVIGGTTFNFTILVGMTKDQILYIAIENFNFYSLLNGDEDAKAIGQIFDSFSDALNSAKGVVIDLRGNPGGQSYALSLFWQSFFQGNVKIAETRSKLSDNRLDYTSWQAETLKGRPDKDYSDIPYVIITNNYTASCAEVSVLIAKALERERGFDITSVGSKTAGANGALTDNIILDAGTTATNEPYLTIRTASVQLISGDGISYEGKGIEPDIEADKFDYSKFSSGEDVKLNKAFEVIRGKINN